MQFLQPRHAVIIMKVVAMRNTFPFLVSWLKLTNYENLVHTMHMHNLLRWNAAQINETVRNKHAEEYQYE
jgi:hypothetical protein